MLLSAFVTISIQCPSINSIFWALAPGAIKTDFNSGSVCDNPDLHSAIASQTALGRAGQADDIGGGVAFLASEEAR